ncbi:hypothetical protein JHK86_050035 [Glycine max]|nr:hypothetical protein JHK86_050035 [Glycine max]
MALTPGAFRLKWEVFLSIRGSDTRNTIMKGLYESYRGAWGSHVTGRRGIGAWGRDKAGDDVDFASHELSCGKNEVSKWREAFKKVGGVSGFGFLMTDVPQNLMVLNLSYCIQLIVIPDLSGCQHLEKTDQENCINLTKIHDSIGSLRLKHLESLFLSSCSKLKALPGTHIGILKSLKELVANDTTAAELPQSIFRLTKLEQLVLESCQYLRRLPSSIGHLCSLQELPDSIESLNNL